MLPPRLIRGRSARAHLLLGLHHVLAGETRVVVVDFVIVPRDDPRAARVRGLQEWIALVQRVTAPVIIERSELEANVLPDATRDRRPFVDIVAEVRDEVELL